MELSSFEKKKHGSRRTPTAFPREKLTAKIPKDLIRRYEWSAFADAARSYADSREFRRAFLAALTTNDKTGIYWRFSETPEGVRIELGEGTGPVPNHAQGPFRPKGDTPTQIASVHKKFRTMAVTGAVTEPAMNRSLHV